MTQKEEIWAEIHRLDVLTKARVLRMVTALKGVILLDEEASTIAFALIGCEISEQVEQASKEFSDVVGKVKKEIEGG